MATPVHENVSLAPAAEPLRLFLHSFDSPAFCQNSVSRCFVLWAVFSLVHGALVALGYSLGLAETGVVVFWPAAGLLAAVLTSTPRRTWPIWLAGMFASRLAVDFLMFGYRPVELTGGFGVGSAIEAIILAVCMQKPMELAYRLRRPLYVLGALLIFAAIATAVGGLIGAAWVNQVQAGNEIPFWENWRIWVAADLLGIIVIAPLASWLLLPQIRFRAPKVSIADYLVLVTATVACFGLPLLNIAGIEKYSAATDIVAALLMTLPLFWAAIRFSYPVTALTQLVFVIAVVTSAFAGVGPFAFGYEDLLPELARIQIYLCVSIVTVLLLAFVLMERQRALVEMRMHRGIGSVLVTLTEKLAGADSANIDASIEFVLEEIGRFARADRCILFQIDPRTTTVASVHNWVRPGIEGHADAVLAADPRQFPWVMQQFREKGYLVLDDFSDHLPEGAEELEEAQRTSPTTRAVLYIGLFSDGELTGVIGCGYARKGVRWGNESLSLMYLVGQLFANVLNRKNAEKALHIYQARLRLLVSEVALTEERARRRTAIDLHDGIGQNLAVARMKIGQLLVDAGDDRKDLTQLRNLIDEALRGTRYIISDLSPSILYELGLVPALESLAERFAIANDVECGVTETGDSWQPGNDMRIALYRAVQEFLNNIARHAQAAKVDIVVEWGANRVDIVVSDDGVGFDIDDATTFREGKSGFGLFSVRESIRLIGGELALESARGIGSKVRLFAPRHDREDDE